MSAISKKNATIRIMDNCSFCFLVVRTVIFIKKSVKCHTRRSTIHGSSSHSPSNFNVDLLLPLLIGKAVFVACQFIVIVLVLNRHEGNCLTWPRVIDQTAQQSELGKRMFLFAASVPGSVLFNADLALYEYMYTLVCFGSGFILLCLDFLLWKLIPLQKIMTFADE